MPDRIQCASHPCASSETVRMAEGGISPRACAIFRTRVCSSRPGGCEARLAHGTSKHDEVAGTGTALKLAEQ